MTLLYLPVIVIVIALLTPLNATCFPCLSFFIFLGINKTPRTVDITIRIAAEVLGFNEGRIQPRHASVPRGTLAARFCHVYITSIFHAKLSTFALLSLRYARFLDFAVPNFIIVISCSFLDAPWALWIVIPIATIICSIVLLWCIFLVQSFNSVCVF